MSGFTPYCLEKFTPRQRAWLSVLVDAIPFREWKRIHSPSSVAEVDSLLIAAASLILQAKEDEADDSFDSALQSQFTAVTNKDGSGKFGQALEAALMAEGAPTIPGVDNVRCVADLAQFACFCNSMAQANSSENISAALEIAKQQKQWYYGCSDAVLQDPLYTEWMDVVKDTSTGTGTGTGGGGGGGMTPTGAKEDDAKSNKNLYIGLGIGAAALAAGAATWFLWPKKAGKARAL